MIPKTAEGDMRKIQVISCPRYSSSKAIGGEWYTACWMGYPGGLWQAENDVGVKFTINSLDVIDVSRELSL